MKTHFTQEWIDWIETNLKAGKDKDGIFKILVDEGYERSAIVSQMGYEPSVPVDQIVNPLRQKEIEEKRIRAAKYWQAVARVNNNGVGIPASKIAISNSSKLTTDLADIRMVDDFLTPLECKKTIDIIKSRLRPSEISNANIDTGYRSSRTCDMGFLKNKFVEEIDLRICKMMGIHRAYSEVMQGQYYEVGQEFKEHTDYFDKSEFAVQCSEFGQRTFTVMIYLNDVEEGGETSFVDIGASVKPKLGTALIWNNLHPDGSPNINTMHKANPVEKGYKAIVTKWFRSKPASGYEHLPMFTQNVNKF